MNKNQVFMQQAIRLALDNVDAGLGGPFGAVIVKDGEIIAEATNTVTSTKDPTAHAEINAIRKASKVLNTFDLSGCELYSSCEPCPMCLAAIYWAHIDKLYVSASKYDAAAAGFDDEFIYKEFDLPAEKRKIQQYTLLAKEGKLPFEKWNGKIDRIAY